jgi:adenylosuccinate lyase
MAGMERMNEEVKMIANVLADRYASQAMQRIWSREEKIRRERRLWVEVMKAQSRLGMKITQDEIARYEDFIEKVDLASIDKRERALKHDVKARIEEFNALAGLQLIHLGLTSRDVTENVELVQTRDALALVRTEVVGVLTLFSKRIERHKDLVMVGRSHNVPAQLTTLGKRFATIAEELLFALERLESLIERLPLRGLRGPVGTSQDLENLLGGESAKVESEIASSLGFDRVLDSTGQIYPRSIDFEVLSTLVQLSAAPSNLAILVRLMSGAGLLSEGFKEGQVGSSAMPHKVNARSSERINGLAVVLKGYLSMMSEVSGDQWNEGDVSCSVVRRVALPDAFFVIDGILQTTASVISELEIFEEVIAREVEDQLPFTSTTHLLMEAVKRGMGRESAHKVIQRHSLSALEKTRRGERHSFFHDLGSDSDFPLSSEESLSLAIDYRDLVGASASQIARVLTRIEKLSHLPSVLFEEIR